MGTAHESETFAGSSLKLQKVNYLLNTKHMSLKRLGGKMMHGHIEYFSPGWNLSGH